MIRAPSSFQRLLKPAPLVLAIALVVLSGGLAKAQWPDIIEAKAIAEEGFIYGLPIVMNYAVMHEFAVDTNSGQYKAPFNQINNKRASSPTKTRPSSRRTATRPIPCLAGFARRADGDLRSGGGKGALLLGAVRRRQHLQLWLHRQPRDRQLSRRLYGRRPRLEWRRRPPASRRYSIPRHAFSRRSIRTQLFNPDDMPNVIRCRPATKCSRFRPILKQPAPPAAPKIDFSQDRQGNGQEKFLRVSRLRPAVRARRRRRTRKFAPSSRSIGIGPGKTFDFKDLPSNTRSKSGWA